MDASMGGRKDGCRQQAEWVQGQHMFVRRPSASRRMAGRDMRKQTLSGLVPFHAFSSSACSSHLESPSSSPRLHARCSMHSCMHVRREEYRVGPPRLFSPAGARDGTADDGWYQ